jgi:hypothetical protein
VTVYAQLPRLNMAAETEIVDDDMMIVMVFIEMA